MGSLWHRNQMSLITFALVAVYLGIAFAFRGGLLGILPLAMSLRARARHEPLAPVALGVAVIGLAVGIATLL